MFKSKILNNLLMSAFALSILVVGTTACNLPSLQTPEPEKPVEEVVRRYRMYFDSSSAEKKYELQIRYFDGELRLADIEAVFGDVDALPRDSEGNYVGGPILDDGLIWSLVVSPSQIGTSLVTSDLDGTLSSALDLDGDRIADIVDMRLGDGRRFSFVTEGLGMGIFEGWLHGKNPLCDSSLVEELDLESFGCADEEGSGDESSVSGGGVNAGSGYVDPLDLVCADYNSSRPRFNTHVMTLFGPERGDKETWEGFWWDTYGDLGRNYGIMTNQTIIYHDADGNHSRTLRMIFYFNDQGELIQTTEETVDSDGNGSRRVITFENGRQTNSTVRPFHATLEPDGNYDSYGTDPASPVPDPDTSEESDVPSGESPPDPPLEGPDNPYPGPDGDDTSLEDFCSRRENFISGVEQAAATDPTAFRVGCGDLVGAPAGGDNCTIIEWAGPGDFNGALEPSGEEDGCDPFYVRGQGGDCEPSTALETLRGRTAMIASANLQGIVVCPPIVCNPSPVSVESRQEISSDDITPEQVITVTPSTPTPTPTAAPAEPMTMNFNADSYSIFTGTCTRLRWDVKNAEEIRLDGEVVQALAARQVCPTTTKTYRLVGTAGDEQLAGQVTIEVSAPQVPPEAPEKLVISNRVCTDQAYSVTLSWMDQAENEDGYRVYRNGDLVATLGANTATYTDNPPGSGPYTYGVEGFNSVGVSSRRTVQEVGCLY